MKYHKLYLKALTVFVTCLMLQSCFVQKNSESHASMIFDPYPAQEEKYTDADKEALSLVTVEENNEQNVSLQALNTSLLLIDFPNEHKTNRWEDHLSYRNVDQVAFENYAER